MLISDSDDEILVTRVTPSRSAPRALADTPRRVVVLDDEDLGGGSGGGGGGGSGRAHFSAPTGESAPAALGWRRPGSESLGDGAKSPAATPVKKRARSQNAVQAQVFAKHLPATKASARSAPTAVVELLHDSCPNPATDLSPANLFEEEDAVPVAPPPSPPSAKTTPARKRQKQRHEKQSQTQPSPLPSSPLSSKPVAPAAPCAIPPSVSCPAAVLSSPPHIGSVPVNSGHHPPTRGGPKSISSFLAPELTSDSDFEDFAPARSAAPSINPPVHDFFAPRSKKRSSANWVPCEFCNESIARSMLPQHLAHCKVRYAGGAKRMPKDVAVIIANGAPAAPAPRGPSTDRTGSVCSRTRLPTDYHTEFDFDSNVDPAAELLQFAVGDDVFGDNKGGDGDQGPIEAEAYPLSGSKRAPLRLQLTPLQSHYNAPSASTQPPLASHVPAPPIYLRDGKTDARLRRSDVYERMGPRKAASGPDPLAELLFPAAAAPPPQQPVPAATTAAPAATAKARPGAAAALPRGRADGGISRGGRSCENTPPTPPPSRPEYARAPNGAAARVQDLFNGKSAAFNNISNFAEPGDLHEDDEGDYEDFEESEAVFRDAQDAEDGAGDAAGCLPEGFVPVSSIGAGWKEALMHQFASNSQGRPGNQPELMVPCSPSPPRRTSKAGGGRGGGGRGRFSWCRGRGRGRGRGGSGGGGGGPARRGRRAQAETQALVGGASDAPAAVASNGGGGGRGLRAMPLTNVHAVADLREQQQQQAATAKAQSAPPLGLANATEAASPPSIWRGDPALPIPRSQMVNMYDDLPDHLPDVGWGWESLGRANFT